MVGNKIPKTSAKAAPKPGAAAAWLGGKPPTARPKKQKKPRQNIPRAPGPPTVSRLAPSRSSGTAISSQFTVVSDLTLEVQAGATPQPAVIAVLPWGAHLGEIWRVDSNGVFVSSRIVSTRAESVAQASTTDSALASGLYFRWVRACVEVLNITPLASVAGTVEAAYVEGDFVVPTSTSSLNDLVDRLRQCRSLSAVSAAEGTKGVCVHALPGQPMSFDFNRVEYNPASTPRIGADWEGLYTGNGISAGGLAAWFPGMIVLRTVAGAPQSYRLKWTVHVEAVPQVGSAMEPAGLPLRPDGYDQRVKATSTMLTKPALILKRSPMARTTAGYLGG